MAGPVLIGTEQFLKTVITTPSGYFHLLYGINGVMKEEWYQWPQDVEKIALRAAQVCETQNVYFSSYLYKKADSHKENVLPSATIQADLDNADVSQLEARPTVLVETSPGRHQGYWVMKELLPLDEHEKLSKRITYSIQDCDRSGWALGRKVRIPGTRNHKYNSSQKVFTTNLHGKRYSKSDLEQVFEAEVNAPSQTMEEEWLDHLPSLEVGPQELLNKYKGKMPRKVVAYFNTTAKDRSAALWGLMQSLGRVGATRDEIYWLAKHSANNKFASDMKYGADRDLAKDVLRSEHVLGDKSNTEDARIAINEIRKMNTPQSERRMAIANVVIKALELQGEFVQLSDESYYVSNVTGRPVYLGQRSDRLSSMLESKFGLNITEPEFRYTASMMVTHTHDHGKSAELGALSYYLTDKQMVLIHGGRRDVYAITANDISKYPNGSFDVVFPWKVGDEPFLLEPPLDDWAATLFEGYFNNVVDLTHQQVIALFKVFILFIMFRNVSAARPILALFGQPGSGKSTLFRLIYGLLYGSRKGVSSVTKEDDFDHVVSHDPFVVLDNVDTWNNWLPDRLALAAGSSDINKRKLYTDQDTVTIKRTAMVGISAHNPKFGREDVVDRLLLVNFQRLKDSQFKSETDLLEKVKKLRNQVWGSIVLDIQKCLRTPMLSNSEVPSFRIKDFALYGSWIARAVGCEKDFREAIEETKVSQTTFTINEEGVLIDIVKRWHERRKPDQVGKFWSAGELWNLLQAQAPDPQSFTRAYKNSVSFKRKLSAVQETFKSIFRMEYNASESKWLIEPREELK